MKRQKGKRSDVLLVGYEDGENLGLRSIAAFLEKHSVRTRIQPYQPSREQVILARIRSERPKIVGFSLIFQRMLFEFASLIEFLRRNRIQAHFTMGGHFPTLEFKTTLELMPGLDSVVRNEGEQTLLELFHRMERPDLWKNIKGLVYRADGKIHVTTSRPLIANLDSLPWPVRDHPAATHRGIALCSMLASRGCFHNCSFCSIQAFYKQTTGPKRRTRSASDVAAEMERLFKERGVRIFTFKDDDLCTKGSRQRQWIDDFASELKKRKLAEQIIWRISCRVDEVDAELMRRLKDVGLAVLYIGIESGSNQGLRTFNKGYTVDDIHPALDTLRKLGICFEYGFMLFDPDSTMASVAESLAFLKKLGRDGQVVIHFTKMFPYAGAPITQRLKTEARLKGTIASPDYSYKDPRLDVFQWFCSVLYFRNFDPRGLVNKLQMAAFDSVVLNRFFPDKYDTRAYAHAVRDLTRQSNEATLEMLSMAIHFMRDRNEEQILSSWHVLERLAQEQISKEREITAALDWLMSRYDFGIEEN